MMGRRRALSESGGQAHTVTASASAVTASTFAVTASAKEKEDENATFYGHDPAWVKGLIESAIKADAEEFGYTM